MTRQTGLSYRALDSNAIEMIKHLYYKDDYSLNHVSRTLGIAVYRIYAALGFHEQAQKAKARLGAQLRARRAAARLA